MTLSESELRTIQEAFDSIDFTQPKAHEVFSELSLKVERLVTDIKTITDREFRFYALGAAYEEARQKHLTIAPVLVESVQKDGKQE